MLRRQLIHGSLASLAAKSLADHHGGAAKNPETLFKVSLAQWSNHRALKAAKFTNMEWPEYTKKTFGIRGLEYVNQFFKDKAEDKTYLAELKKRVTDLEMENVLIMIDGEGHLGASSAQERQKTVDQHKKWVEAAQFLGCHSIRVNSHGEGETDDEKASNCVKGLSALTTFANEHEIGIIVENHGGLSSNGEWMAKVLADVGMDGCGSLPDFGNFHDYDRYKGLKELMPFAKGVSAKSHDFDAEGNETKTDFRKALKIVMDFKFHGWIGIEYEGNELSEVEGITATKKLLEKVRSELS